MPKRPAPDYLSLHAEPPTLKPPLTPLGIIPASMRPKYASGDHDGAVAPAHRAAAHLHHPIPAATPATELAMMSDANLDAPPTKH